MWVKRIFWKMEDYVCRRRIEALLKKQGRIGSLQFSDSNVKYNNRKEASSYSLGEVLL